MNGKDKQTKIRVFRVFGQVWSLGSCGGSWSLDLLHMCKAIEEKFEGKCERIDFEEPKYDGPDCIRGGRVLINLDVVVPENRLDELIDEIAWGLGHYWNYPSQIEINKKDKKIVLRWKLAERILNLEEVQ